MQQKKFREQDWGACNFQRERASYRILAYFFASLALIISALSFLYLRAFVIKKTSAARISQEVREEVQHIITEIDRVTDSNMFLIEQRIEQLKTILTDADRRIGALGREVEARDRRDAAYAELGRKKKPSATSTNKTDGTDKNELFDGGPAPEQPVVAVPPTQYTKQEQIILLSASGLTPAQISAKLNMTITEIEMVLVLHKKDG
ncbi:MAG: hypothetical protein LBD22_06525 [Spirochaetaceae bacterium]|nr:hypothetical protein [Spirochaetaceae bacterium]